MRRSHAALLAIALLSAATPAPAYEIIAQTTYELSTGGEGSAIEPEVSGSYFLVLPVTGNIVDITSFVSGQSGVLEGRSRVDIVGGTSTSAAKWLTRLREDLVLDPAPGATEVVVRGSLQVVTNSSAVVYPAGAQGYAFQHVRLHIEFEDNAPATNIQAEGHMVQNMSTDPATLWEGTPSVSPPEAGTATGSTESGSVELEIRIPINIIGGGDVLKVEAQLSGEADAGNHPTSYAESGLETQLAIDVGGGTYAATFPFFLAPEPEGALLGEVALAALAARRRWLLGGSTRATSPSSQPSREPGRSAPRGARARRGWA